MNMYDLIKYIICVLMISLVPIFAITDWQLHKGYNRKLWNKCMFILKYFVAIIHELIMWMIMIFNTIICNNIIYSKKFGEFYWFKRQEVHLNLNKANIGSFRKLNNITRVNDLLDSIKKCIENDIDAFRNIDILTIRTHNRMFENNYIDTIRFITYKKNKRVKDTRRFQYMLFEIPYRSLEYISDRSYFNKCRNVEEFYYYIDVKQIREHVYRGKLKSVQNL